MGQVLIQNLALMIFVVRYGSNPITADIRVSLFRGGWRRSRVALICTCLYRRDRDFHLEKLKNL
jgi:hypothetical protein